MSDACAEAGCAEDSFRSTIAVDGSLAEGRVRAKSSVISEGTTTYFISLFPLNQISWYDLSMLYSASIRKRRMTRCCFTTTLNLYSCTIDCG